MAHMRRTHCWFDDPLSVLRFERRARTEHPRLRGGPNRAPRRLRYDVELSVPAFDIVRRATIVLLPSARALVVHVRVDGPQESPHRFADGTLCMWYGRDAEFARWTQEDGLAALLDRIRIHLWQEERWRRTGEWVGDEAPHAPARGPRR
jgi:hypothetical protein